MGDGQYVAIVVAIHKVNTLPLQGIPEDFGKLHHLRTDRGRRHDAIAEQDIAVQVEALDLPELVQEYGRTRPFIAYKRRKLTVGGPVVVQSGCGLHGLPARGVDVLGVVRNHGKIERAIYLRRAQRVTHLVKGMQADQLALGKFIRLRGRGGGSETRGIQRQCGMNVQIAEIRIS